MIFTAIVYIVIELHASGCKLLNILWKPFHPVFHRFRRSFNIRGSVITTFATFICLSYSKVIITTLNIFNYTIIYSSSNTNHSNHTQLYFNSSISYRAARNVPYFLVATLMMTIFNILPLVTLLVFHTRLCQCFHRYRLICELVKVFHKHFKDGVDNSADYRSLSGLYLVFRVLYGLTFAISDYYYVQWLLSFFMVLTISYLHPYKEKRYNCFDTFWFAGLTIFFVSIHYISVSEVSKNNLVNIFVSWITLTLPFVYANFLLLLYIAKRMKACNKNCFKTCCQLKINSSRNSTHEEIPDRLLNPAEYRPLLQK